MVEQLKVGLMEGTGTASNIIKQIVKHVKH